MKAGATQRKATATGGRRKLKLSKETLQDLTPSGKQRGIKGGVTEAAACTALGTRTARCNFGSTIYGGG